MADFIKQLQNRFFKKDNSTAKIFALEKELGDYDPQWREKIPQDELEYLELIKDLITCGFLDNLRSKGFGSQFEKLVEWRATAICHRTIEHYGIKMKQPDIDETHIWANTARGASLN